MSMPLNQNGTTLKKYKGRKSYHLISTPKLPHESVKEALFHIQDIMERSHLQFVLLDEVADQIANREDPILNVCEISLGIRITDFTEYGSSTFKALAPAANWKEFLHGYPLTTINYEYGSVPIVVWLIRNDLDLFRNPDTRFYYQSEFKVPNPFRDYWKNRNLIR